MKPPSFTTTRLQRAGGTALLLLGLSSLFATTTTTTASAATPVDLGVADRFAVLAGSGITNTGPTTVTGDIGSHPTPSITNVEQITFIDGTNQAGNAVTQQAKIDLLAAYNQVAAEPPTAAIGQELVREDPYLPGVYQAAGSLQLSGTIVLDAQGDPNAIFIFKTPSTLTTASNSQVLLVNGANACNVYWQVGSSATFGTGTTFAGNVLAQTSITATTGATFDGRLLANDGAVTLDTNTITGTACTTAPGGGTGVEGTTTEGTETEGTTTEGTETEATTTDGVTADATTDGTTTEDAVSTATATETAGVATDGVTTATTAEGTETEATTTDGVTADATTEGTTTEDAVSTATATETAGVATDGVTTATTAEGTETTGAAADGITTGTETTGTETTGTTTEGATVLGTESGPGDVLSDGGTAAGADVAASASGGTDIAGAVVDARGTGTTTRGLPATGGPSVLSLLLSLVLVAVGVGVLGASRTTPAVVPRHASPRWSHQHRR